MATVEYAFDKRKYFSTTHKDNKICTNCGKKGHEYKECREAITSIGVILINLNVDIDHKLKFIKNINNKPSAIEINNKGIKIKNKKDIKYFSFISSSIKFLMIKRKHSLGYIEFIRGRYKPDNIDGIVFLFQQMTQEEINKINFMTFDQLWDDFWVDENKKKLYEKEYNRSKQKFTKLATSDEFNIKFYAEHVKPKWNQGEWGFPKGRRNKMESNIECSKREFEEESGFGENDYIILENIKPLQEEFFGTDGVKYKHIYYIGLSVSDKMPAINTNNLNQSGEIGDIGYFAHYEAIKIIRSYHTSRIQLLTNLYMFIAEQLIENMDDKEQETVENNN
jgi:hypothetical protein